MVHKLGDKVMVDGEECEVVGVFGGGSVYQVRTPGGTTKRAMPEQMSEVEGELGGEDEETPPGEGETEPGEEPGPGEEDPPPGEEDPPE